MAENDSGTTDVKSGWVNNKWTMGGLVLLIFILFWALIHFVHEINSLGESAEGHEGRIAVLEKNDSQSAGKIRSSQKTMADVREEQSSKIDIAIKDHERRLHSKKPPASRHHPTARSPKARPAKNIDAVALLASAIKSCADRGGELVSENGKVACVPKVIQPPVQTVPPKVADEPVQTTPLKVAQLDTSKVVGTPCPGDDYRSATYQIINGQVACLLDGVVRVTESYHRPEPEVVYVNRIIREELPSQQDEVYYEEDQGGSGLSSWVPWGIAAGALLWGANNHKTSQAPVAVQGRAPAGVLNGRAPAGVLGGAW